MKTILILGAGLSSSSLIRYLLEHAETNQWNVRIVDRNLDLLINKINGNPRGTALNFNALLAEERRDEIQKADLVISMLPAKFHVDIARDCVEFKTHLITPSYVSPEMHDLHQEAINSGVLLMNEIGVDPGIDHMSAARIIDEIKAQGGEIIGFKSYCGGLISPDCDNNPWNYKFTWNPTNVVLAGHGGAAKYIEQGEYKFVPYHQLFKRLDKIKIPGYGSFEGYGNRDSLSYRNIYGLENIPTIFRGTLRRPGFCKAWNIFVQLGMTDDSYPLENSENLTPRQFLNAFMPYVTDESVEHKFKRLFTKENEELFEKFAWLGFFDSNETFGIPNASPAQLLEKMLVAKLSLGPNDKDMLVMFHSFRYKLNGKIKKTTSSMVNIGEDKVYTSMSNTVGLPVAICAKMILNHEIKLTGVQIPVLAEIYNPVLNELETLGIGFQETWD